MKRSILILVLSLLFAVSGLAQDFSSLKKNISEFTLPNGLKFILLEDHSVPIIFFATYANVGGSDERPGIFGISHFLEHMAFKGTTEIGSKNIEEEQKLLAKMDDVFEKIKAERGSPYPDEAKIKAMDAELEKLGEEASKHVEPNEFINILERNGSQYLNAGTSKDSTMYYYSLPSNKLELWAYLESSRFIDPFFREFYKERGVIMEERRVRIDNSPLFKLIEELVAMSFKNHTYQELGIGPMSDIKNITRDDMYAYFKSNYHAGNLVIGVNGDVTLPELKKMAEKYFSKMPSGKKNLRILTEDPEQLGEKSMTLYEDSQPTVALGYHIPSVLHPDFVKLQMLSNILTDGRSSRLTKRLEIDDKLVLSSAFFPGFPGTKYPTLFIFFAMPNSGRTNDEVVKVFDEEMEKIKKNGVSEEELAAAKKRLKVNIIRSLKSQNGLTISLLQSEIVKGSWKKAFDSLTELMAVTTEDIKTVANKYIIKSGRTIGRIEKKEEKKEAVQ